ncbi:MAG: hypothetical protein IKD87_07255 [Oscillospiraceae bacterium]|nr:hypothetical protein [Oscillospiraceae bacterium]
MERYIAYRVDRQKYNANRGALDNGWFIFAQNESDLNWTFVSQAPTKEDAIKAMRFLKEWEAENKNNAVVLYDEHGYGIK